jgi:actin-like ATPase involved in cell morphogenesis
VTYALGVDLGTTYTAAGLYTGGRAETVPLGTDALAIPSVAFLGDDIVFGDRALLLAESQPQRLTREFKRHFGEENPLFVGDRMVSADVLMGALAAWVVDRTSELQGDAPDHVVITYPASWGPFRRERLTAAVAGAVNAQVSLLTEPEAAAVFYATRDRLPIGATVVVYDLGGGTFDATILRKSQDAIELVGRPMGDENLGGADLDGLVLDLISRYAGIDIATLDRDDPFVVQAIGRLRHSATKAKELLSTELDTVVGVMLPNLAMEVRVTRREVETLATPLLARTVQTLTAALEGAGVAAEDLHAILLVGGGSRMPLVGQLLTERFPVKLAVDAHPKFAVCLGAAIVAGSHAHGRVVDRLVEDDLPPPLPANIRKVSSAPPVASVELGPEARAPAEFEMPPLQPAHLSSPVLPPPVAPSVPVPTGADVDSPGEAEPTLATIGDALLPPPAPPELDQPPLSDARVPDEIATELETTAWLREPITSSVDLEYSSLLGIKDLPVTAVAARRVRDQGPTLLAAETLVIDSRGTGAGKRVTIAILAVVAAVVVLLLVLILAKVANAASATPAPRSTVPSALGDGRSPPGEA